jgi:hypothetical protein
LTSVTAQLTRLFSVGQNYSCYFSPSIHRKQRWQLSGPGKKLVTRWKAMNPGAYVFIRAGCTPLAHRNPYTFDAFDGQSAPLSCFLPVDLQTKKRPASEPRAGE